MTLFVVLENNGFDRWIAFDEDACVWSQLVRRGGVFFCGFFYLLQLVAFWKVVKLNRANDG